MAHRATSGSSPIEATAALHAFHPVVARWFRQRFGAPTPTQSEAWPRIAAGEHVLVTAPTGSGKTLAAFLWSLNQLFSNAWSGNCVRVLYVSPLRALNNDIRRNLLGPLDELESAFRDSGTPVQKVRVATRSGDTPSAERQRMIRSPPEILITTPETLNILLTSTGGRSILCNLSCVILDEIHAAAGSKRGTHLITAVERLTLLSGEFQRIALSATVRPAARIARMVGGRQLVASPEDGEPLYRQRDVAVIDSPMAKQYGIVVESNLARAEGASVWDPLITDLRQRIRENRSTLVFSNSRRLTEKLSRLLNEGERRDLAYSHHGSLSREIRAVVEERLKAGQLAAIVATSSLELGIDIGSLDEVILVRTPPTVAAAVQRLGRAGHAVGEVSRGRFYPLYERDLLDAAAVAGGVVEQDIEEIVPVAAPLDVLAQVMLSMVAAEAWQIEDLYRFVCTAYPYRELKRRQFDLVLEMLAGRYADSRIRELEPRLSVDRLDRSVRARRGAERLIYSAGGTIPDRGYLQLRLHDGQTKLGELDEEFVWERSVGDTFSLGAQNWQITAITHNDVFVRPAHRASAMAPFWRAEAQNRSFHLSARIGRLLERAEEMLAKKKGSELLRRHLEQGGLSGRAAADLTRFLEAQRAQTGRRLPHRHHLLLERVVVADSELGQRQFILHTLWGGRVNRPLALALTAVWEEECGEALQIEHDNDGLLLLLPAGVDPIRLLQKVQPDNVERLLRRRLEQSGFFGARFRENAGRALLLPRSSFRRRVPLWLSRLRAKKLLAAVQRYEDFPVLVETWRSCLQDEFDLENLAKVLLELESGEIECSETTTTTPSPFAADVAWKRTNRLMYEDDQPEQEGKSRVRRDLLRELVHGSRLRPRMPDRLIDQFERKLQRTHPGYAPQTSEDLIDWVKERQVLSAGEWQELVDAVQRDAGLDSRQLQELLSEVARRVVRVEPGSGSPASLVAHLEMLPRLARCYGSSTEELRAFDLLDETTAVKVESELVLDPETDPVIDLIVERLRFQGPVRRALIGEDLGLERQEVSEVLETLVADERVVIDQFRQGAEEEDEVEVCDTENLERLLRLLRAAGRRSFAARPISELPLFLARHQGLAASGGDPEGLMSTLETLFGYPAPVRLWESDLLPARLDPYYLSWLDGLFHDTDLIWLGCGRERVTFCLRSDLELLRDAWALDQDGGKAEVLQIFPRQEGRYAYDELLQHSAMDPAQLTQRLWELSWQGRISSSTFEILRQGTVRRFRSAAAAERENEERPWRGRRRRHAHRGRFERWRSRRTESGEWFVITDPESAETERLDALELEELGRDRARLLLHRYGILFRELSSRELPLLQWSRLFRSLRLMELSGEVISGHFFQHLHGLQFMSQEAFKSLREGLPEDAIFWLNAADPASACGLGIYELKDELPARRYSTHLVYQGSSLVVISQRHGGELEIRVDPDHPRLPEYLEFLKTLLTRQFAPRRVLTIETINGQPANDSPYAPLLAMLFTLTREPAGLKVRRRY